MFAPDDAVAAAATALTAWGLADAEVSVLSVSENVVCQAIGSDGSRYALRLHRPGYNSLAELRSEVEWVRSLARHGLRVPAQVPTLAGEHFVAVYVAGRSCFAGLIEWVDGHPLHEEIEDGSGDIAGWFRTLGQSAGHIRGHSRAWRPPGWFERRRWDVDGLLGEDPLWGRFWMSPALDASARAVLLEARVAITGDLAQIPLTPDRFGMIHADLHLGNVMVHESELTIIDFDDAGYGYFGYELAVALHHLVGGRQFDAARAALVEGYLAVEPDAAIDVAHIDVFLAVRSIIMVGWLSARPNVPEYEHLDRTVARAVAAAAHYLDHRGT